jgi:hypothetical protein
MPQAPQETNRGPKRIPLVVTAANRGESTSTDARVMNAYVEKAPDGGLWVVKRPGLSVTTAFGASAGSGIYNWLGDIYEVFGATLYKNAVAVAGTVNTAGGVYTFTSCLGATPKLFLQNGLAGYTYDAVGGLVHVVDADYPAALVKGSAYLDGTIYVMDAAANIYGSGINDPTSWDPVNMLKAQIEPDGGVCLAKQLVYVIALYKEQNLGMDVAMRIQFRKWMDVYIGLRQLEVGLSGL